MDVVTLSQELSNVNKDFFFTIILHIILLLTFWNIINENRNKS